MDFKTALIIVAAASSAWYVQAVRWDSDVSNLKLAQQKEKREAAEQGEQKANNALINQRIAEARLAAADLKYTTELKDELKKNAVLAAAVADGSRRVRVSGSCTQAAATGSVGNDGTVELSGSAGRNLYAVRAGILEDRKKINYLHSYIVEHCPQ